MEIAEILDNLKQRALRDDELRQEFLRTKEQTNPLSAFCAKCRELGYEIYDMDVIMAGEEFHAGWRAAPCRIA